MGESVLPAGGPAPHGCHSEPLHPVGTSDRKGVGYPYHGFNTLSVGRKI